MPNPIKPIKVWGKGGPNPPKVVFILEELDVPYEVIPIPFSDIKNPEYLAVNPNGRLPAIQDPNTGVTLWESGAIIEYLVDKYDHKQKLSFPAGSAEFYHARQYLFFQTTGQGPYYGQAMVFKKFHHERLPSAVERYAKEANRVTSVLETVLAAEQQKYGDRSSEGPWLVGNKLSYADIAFFPWQNLADTVIFTKEEYDVANFPHVKRWMEALSSLESIKKVQLSG